MTSIPILPRSNLSFSFKNSELLTLAIVFLAPNCLPSVAMVRFVVSDEVTAMSKSHSATPALSKTLME